MVAFNGIPKTLFSNGLVEGYFREEFVDVQDDAGVVYCRTFSIDPASSDVPRYARFLAFNGYKWSDSLCATLLSTTAGRCWRAWANEQFLCLPNQYYLNDADVVSSSDQ